MARIPWVAPKALPVPIEDAASRSRGAHAGGGAGAETAHDEPSARSGADWTDPRGVRIACVIDEFLQGFAAITTGYRLLFPQKPLFFRSGIAAGQGRGMGYHFEVDPFLESLKEFIPCID
jgi:hypothetical protein